MLTFLKWSRLYICDLIKTDVWYGGYDCMQICGMCVNGNDRLNYIDMYEKLDQKWMLKCWFIKSIIEGMQILWWDKTK